MISWKKKRCLAALFLSACMTASLFGCGQEKAPVGSEDVVLLEPVGVGESYELPQYRNIYDAKVYNGLICPYTEEYKLKEYRLFEEYCALPGTKVKKGQTIIRTDTENLDKQIENMEKSIAESEESYQEYLKDSEKPLKELRSGEKFWGGVVKDWEKEKPEEFFPVLDEEGVPVLNEDGTPEQVNNPEYEKWNVEMQGYEVQYRNILISLQKLEAEMEQREELYQLDLAHNQVLLERMKKERDANTLLSEMDGYVANIKHMSKGGTMAADTPMVAVANLNRKLIKSEFVNKTDVTGAEQVFAIVDGVRYEVEYEPMDSAEYKRLQEENDKVFTTFYLPEELKDAEVGSYVAIVVIKKSKQDALTVSRKAVSKNDEGSFVYVLRDGERVYTPVKTGMQDGLFVEILSGIEAGDKVLSEAEQPEGKQTMKLGTGSVSYQFTKNGTLAYVGQERIDNPVEQGTVYLESFEVDMFQQVKKGDVIARIRVVGDDVELARQEKKIAREKERLEELQKEDQDRSEEEKQNTKTIKAKEKYIAGLEEELAEMQADYATTEITAPYDGIISDVNASLRWTDEVKSGDILPYGFYFVTLSSKESNYIAVEDENGLLTYGNHAIVDYTSVDGTMKTAEGEVVTLNPYSVSKRMFEDAKQYSDQKPYALIKLPAEVMGDMAGSYVTDGNWWRESVYTVKVTTRKMDNVLLVPKRAVINNAGATYAKVKMADGTVMYQGFIAGGSDNDNYWVVEGLTEGMEVCTE